MTDNESVTDSETVNRKKWFYHHYGTPVILFYNWILLLHIPGKMNPAATFSSRMVSNRNEKIIPKNKERFLHNQTKSTLTQEE